MFERLFSTSSHAGGGSRIRRGLDIAVPGAPRQAVGARIEVQNCGLMANDYPGVRPAMQVEVGDRVAAGDAVFIDRRRPEIVFTAPIAGTVTGVIGRSITRAPQCIVIRREGQAAREFSIPPETAGRDDITAILLESGLWPGFRTRPFGGIPDPESVPDALFVTAMASDPLAADAAVVIAGFESDFAAGLRVVAKLTDGPLHVCQAPGPKLHDRATEFSGPHPAGLPGTHIHFLHPVGAGGMVWHIDYQDVIAIGRLFRTGAAWRSRIISLAGPGVRDPELCRVALGANLAEITAGRLQEGDMRVISGSVLSGQVKPYLSRYHTQVSVLPEGWEVPRSTLFSRPLSTALEGNPGPLIPVNGFDRVMPLGLLPVPLLRALSVGDRETALRLGCLELTEDDLALLSYVCPGRGEYGPMLRAVLDDIAGGA